MDILTNPIVVSVIIMSVLCLLKMNVMLAILVAAVIAGLTGGMNLTTTISTLISGMGATRKPHSVTSCWAPWLWPLAAPAWLTLQPGKLPR